MKTYLFVIYFDSDTEPKYQEVIAPSKEQAQIMLFTIHPDADIINTFVEA